MPSPKYKLNSNTSYKKEVYDKPATVSKDSESEDGSVVMLPLAPHTPFK